MMRVWITGAAGLLGQAMQRVLYEQKISFAASARQEVDLNDPLTFERFWKSAGPFTHLINCAAYTKVDQAEDQKQLAYQINAQAPQLLGRFAAAKQMKVVHLSTDYVFNGKGVDPYKELDPKDPQTVYGQTKAVGEELLLAELPTACIVRTSWVFGPGGKTFISTLQELCQKQQEIKVVSDQRGRPTYSVDLARALVHLLDQSGIYHVANQGETSWYLLAKECFKQHRFASVSSQEFPAKAPRPLYSVLDTTKFDRFIAPLRPWQEALEEFIHA